jgi:hypothetical protein
LVTAIAPGTAIITVETEEGGYTATCNVTVEEQNVVVETPQATGNEGVIRISLNLPSQESFAATFVLKLPQGFHVDRNASALADDLAADYQLDITQQTGNSWLFEISLKPLRSLRADTEYRDLVDVVYTIDESVNTGSYEAKLTDVELTLSDNTVIREDEIRVELTRGNADGILPASSGAYVYYYQGILTVNTPATEQIAIYSMNGSLLYQSQKGTGEAAYRIDHLPKGVLIVKGSSGWVKKIK